MHVAETNGAGSLQRARPLLARRFVRVLGRAAAACWGWLRRAAERSSQRRALALLSDRLLRDVGLSRVEAETEARKPFWLD